MIIWHPATLHGGLPYINEAKTRRSFVMHITPENLPIKHIDYFFNPNKIIEPVSKVYEDYSGRQIEVGDQIDFMHKKSFIADVLAILNKLGVGKNEVIKNYITISLPYSLHLRT